ncbi:MAG: hypothetical protein ACLSAH_08410 [Bilophila wadsworthia]
MLHCARPDTSSGKRDPKPFLPSKRRKRGIRVSCTPSPLKTIDRIIEVSRRRSRADTDDFRVDSVIIAQRVQTGRQEGRHPRWKLAASRPRNMIRESKTFQLPTPPIAMGMQTMDDDIERRLCSAHRARGGPVHAQDGGVLRPSS